jgi:hypothetical protein
LGVERRFLDTKIKKIKGCAFIWSSILILGIQTDQKKKLGSAIHNFAVVSFNRKTPTKAQAKSTRLDTTTTSVYHIEGCPKMGEP